MPIAASFAGMSVKGFGALANRNLPRWLNFISFTSATTNTYSQAPSKIGVDGTDSPAAAYYSGSDTGQIVQYTATGGVRWARTLGSGNFGATTAFDSARNMYVAGGTYSAGGFLCKFDSNGNLLWQRFFIASAATRQDQFGIAFDASGNVVVSGQYKYSTTSGGYYPSIVRYSPSGTFLNSVAIVGIYGAMTGVECDTSGNVYTCAYMASSGSGKEAAAVVKFNNVNSAVWTKQISGGYSTNPIFGFYDIALDSKTAPTAVYAAGMSNPNSTNGTVPNLTKFNSSTGALVWQRAFTTAANLTWFAVDVDSAGNVYVGGNATNTRYGVIAKYNASGTLQWQRVIYDNASGADTRLHSLSVSKEIIYASGMMMNSAGTIYAGFSVALPTDGSGTGTYSLDATHALTYAAASFTEFTLTYPWSGTTSTQTATFTDSAGTLSITTPTIYATSTVRF